MNDLNKEKLRKEIKDYMIEKRRLVEKLNVKNIKKVQKEIKNIKDEKMNELKDVYSYKAIMETKITVLGNNLKDINRSIEINPPLRNMRIEEVFDTTLKFLTKDYKYLLSDKYFTEVKLYMKYGKNDSNTVYNNLKKMISFKKKIINEYIAFSYNLYKMLPKLIQRSRMKGEDSNGI